MAGLGKGPEKLTAASQKTFSHVFGVALPRVHALAE